MTLLEYIKQSSDWEITVFDKNYDVETYFYNDIVKPKDSWDESMKKLAGLLEVTQISKNGITVNLSDLIESKLEAQKKANLWINCDIDSIMYDIDNVLAGNVSEDWMQEFVEALK